MLKNLKWIRNVDNVAKMASGDILKVEIRELNTCIISSYISLVL